MLVAFRNFKHTVFGEDALGHEALKANGKNHPSTTKAVPQVSAMNAEFENHEGTLGNDARSSSQALRQQSAANTKPRLYGGAGSSSTAALTKEAQLSQRINSCRNLNRGTLYNQLNRKNSEEQSQGSDRLGNRLDSMIR